MKKPDLSKAAMKRFFLLHSEKLVLGFAIALFGVFAWIGYGSSVFSDKTPDELSKMADSADTYILLNTSWDTIKEFRKGNDQAPEIIRLSANNVKADDYLMTPLSGIAAMTLEKRTDPEIYGIIEPHAVAFEAALIAHFEDGTQDPFSAWPLVVSTSDEKPAPGDNQDKFGSDNPGGGSSKDDKPKQEELPTAEGAGSTMFVVNSDTFPGINPGKHRISNKFNKSKVFDIVVVTGLVEVKQQWNAFNNSFLARMGYFPNRDKPTYQYLQVQRREIGVDGKPKPDKLGQWNDISENVSFVVPGFYPEMHRLPNARFPSAPEVTAPENFDSILTQPIPPIVMFDYAPWVNHPKLANAMRSFPKIQTEEDDTEDTSGGMFSRTPRKNKTAKKRGKFSGGAGAGMSAGMGGGGDSPDSPGGPGGAGGSGGAGIGSGGSKGAELADQTRRGSDIADYIKAVAAKKPNADYKLVRFFDLQTKPGTTYEYQMRLWIADPNQTDSNQTFVSLHGKRVEGFNADDDSDASKDGGEPDGADRDDTETQYSQVDITPPMLETSVRIRLGEQTAQTDPDDSSKKTYFVSELRPTENDGEKQFKKIAVPQRSEEGIDANYLRFARPSIWSKPVAITVNNKKPQIAAGKTLPARLSKIGGKEFPIGEPISELVAAVWARNFGTSIPSKQTVYRGDALDFWANAYVLHPITRRVHLAMNLDSDSEGPAKYLVPIETGAVIVDTMGGEELSLPKSDKRRHHLPSEMLIMDGNGNFYVQNDLRDSSAYRNHLLLADSSKYVGRERKTKKEKEKDKTSGAGDKFGGGAGAGAGGPGGSGGAGGADDF